MLVLSPALIISPADPDTAHLPAILWQNLVTTSNITADHEDASYPAIRLANPNTNELWVSDDTGDQDIIVALSGTDPVDAVGIARHNFGSAGITVSIEIDTGSGYSEVASLLPGDDSPILFLFDESDAVNVKVHLVVGSTAPEAAVLFVGKALVLEQGVQPHTPINYGRERDIISGRSEAGDYLGRIQSGGRLKSTATVANLDADHYRDDVDPFIEDGGPYFFTWDPSEHPYEVGYVWNVNDPVPMPTLAGHISITLELEGIVL